MAYGNYGAIVKKNGFRVNNCEDQIPYQENSNLSGYHNAFGQEDNPIRCHHAVLGSGKVRLCASKTYPVLFLDGIKVEIYDYLDGEGTQKYKSWPEETIKKYGGPEKYWDTELEDNLIKGEVEDFKFKIWLDNSPKDNTLHLRLEDLKDKWEAESAYGFGAGWEL